MYLTRPNENRTQYLQHTEEEKRRKLVCCASVLLYACVPMCVYMFFFRLSFFFLFASGAFVYEYGRKSHFLCGISNTNSFTLLQYIWAVNAFNGDSCKTQKAAFTSAIWCFSLKISSFNYFKLFYFYFFVLFDVFLHEK